MNVTRTFRCIRVSQNAVGSWTVMFYRQITGGFNAPPLLETLQLLEKDGSAFAVGDVVQLTIAKAPKARRHP